jgi:hypothetical protein
MPRWLSLSILLPALLVGCSHEPAGDTHTKLVDEFVDTMGQVVQTLRTVKDPDSARAAAKQLEAHAAHVQDINRRRLVLPPPSEEEKQALRDRAVNRTRTLQGEVLYEARRISVRPDLQRIIEPALAKFALPGQPPAPPPGSSTVAPPTVPSNPNAPLNSATPPPPDVPGVPGAVPGIPGVPGPNP